MNDPSSLERQDIDNPINSRVSDGKKSVNSFLGVLAWNILGYCIKRVCVYPI